MKTLLKRFMEKVNKTKACWLWVGALNRTGYGMIRYKNKTLTAHRVSYAMFNGVIPKGNVIMHTCDTPPCVNPKHLLAGTFRENTVDALLKGKLTYIKLTPKDVLGIRKRLATGELHAPIARDYGIGASQIFRISTGYSWRDVK